MADTAARLAISARRNEVARFTIAVTGLDMTGVNLAMQVRLRPDTPGAALISLATVSTLAAEGLKLDSVTVSEGIPTSFIKVRINASTMTDATKVPYTGEVGDNSVLAYAMQWTMGGDAQTRVYGDFIVVASAFGSDSAPTNRPVGYGGSQQSSGGDTGSLTFGDQVVQVSLNGSAELAIYIAATRALVEQARAQADRAALVISNAQALVDQAAAKTKGDPGNPGKDASTLLKVFDYASLTAAQSVFVTPWNYLPTAVTIWMNGTRLRPEDYSAPGGNTFTLLQSAVVGDEVSITAFEVPNALDVRARQIGLMGALYAAPAEGRSISIACEGTSLTYAQQDPTGSRPAINGAGQKRSAVDYPTFFQNTLVQAGFTVSALYHRGFPGDTTIEGLTRWATAGATDLAMIEYGTNDAINAGGYPHGPVSLVAYEQNLELIITRRILAGVAVVVIGAPPIADSFANQKLGPYRDVARRVAERYGCPFIDLFQLLRSVTNLWTDGLHLSTFAYAEWGAMAAAVVASRSGGLTKVASGDLFFPGDGIFVGGPPALLADARARSGYFLPLLPGQFVTVAVEVIDTVSPVIRSFRDGAPTTIGLYYAGGGGVESNLPTGVGESVLTHNNVTRSSQSLVGPILRPGPRLFTIVNLHATNAAYLDGIEFVKAAGHMSHGALRRAEGMLGVFQPRRASAECISWWTYGDFGTKLQAPFSLVGRMRLGDTGYTGLAVWASPPVVTDDYVATNGTIAARQGAALQVWEIVNGAANTFTSVANVFPATGTWDGELEIEVLATAVNIYVDGILKATRAVVFSRGYPGVFSDRATTLLCHSAYVTDHNKGPY